MGERLETWTPLSQELLSKPGMAAKGVFQLREARGSSDPSGTQPVYIGCTEASFQSRLRHILHPGNGVTDLKIRAFMRNHLLEVACFRCADPIALKRRMLAAFSREHGGAIPRLNSPTYVRRRSLRTRIRGPRVTR